MQQFNAGLLTHNYALLMRVREHSGARERHDRVPEGLINQTMGALTALQAIALVIEATESNACIGRLKKSLETYTTYADLSYGLKHLLELMESELEKRKTLIIDADKTKYFLDVRYGTKKNENVLAVLSGDRPHPLFGAAEKAFPAAYTDIVEAGRCLALGRNNAAAYHLSRVAEVGLRALAWDRRVIPKHKGGPIPIELVEWGKLIGGIEGKVDAIKQWKPTLTREEASKFYNRALVEVRSFNDGWRRHLSHTREHNFSSDEALALWGHVYRFMNMLVDKGITASERTPVIWKKAKN